MLTPLSRPSLTLDLLIAEAQQRTRERRELIARLAAAALILGTAFTAAALLQYHRFVENTSTNFVQSFYVTHPWWLYAATLALCLLGIAGAAGVLLKALRAVAIGHTAASVLFLAAGVAALTDTGVLVIKNGALLDNTKLAVALLLLGFVSAVLALTFWSRHRQPDREPSVDPAA